MKDMDELKSTRVSGNLVVAFEILREVAEDKPFFPVNP